MERFCFALLVVWAYVVSGALGDPSDCSAFTTEPTCEGAEGCYWADWMRPSPLCQQRPLVDEDCVCNQDECGGEPALNWDGPSGCEPSRFCQFRLLKCRVQRDLSSDASCLEDGDRTGKCAPSEYCEPSPDAPSEDRYFLFFNQHCILKPGITLFPTAAPTKRPSSKAGLTETPATQDDENEGEKNISAIEPVLLGSGAALLVGVVGALLLYRRVQKRKDDLEIMEAYRAREERIKSRARSLAREEEEMPEF